MTVDLLSCFLLAFRYGNDPVCHGLPTKIHIISYNRLLLSAQKLEYFKAFCCFFETRMVYILSFILKWL